MASSHLRAPVRTTDPSPEDPRDRHHSPLTPLSLFIVLVVFWLAMQLGPLLVSALMAILLGTVLEGPVRRLQDRNVPRAAAIALCYVAVIGIVVGIVFLIVPVVTDQAIQFQDEVPARLADVRDDWLASNNRLLSGPGAALLKTGIDFFDVGSTTSSISGETAANALPVVMRVGTAIASFITTLVITFYYMLEKGFLRQVVIEQLSNRLAPRVDFLWTEVENKVGSWLRGQLLLCLIIGGIATVFYGAIGLNFWPLLGLWAGVTEIIPIVGPWLGGIPAVLVAITTSWQSAVMVALVILGMQTLENWFLVPRVMKGAVGLTPMTVFVAILAGTQLSGPIGAVLAIPIVAAMQVILTDILKNRRDQLKTPATNLSGWRWMLGMGRDVTPHPTADDESTQVVSEQTFAPLVGPDVPAGPEDAPADGPAAPLDQRAAATWPSSRWRTAPSEDRPPRPTPSHRRQRPLPPSEES